MRQRHGFTLIELLVVVSIIALLGGMLLSGLLSSSTKVKYANSLQVCNSVRDAILAYATDCGELPIHEGTSGQYSGTAGTWVYQLQRMGKNPPYVNGLDSDDVEMVEPTTSGGMGTGQIFDKFGGALVFRACGASSDYRTYRGNNARLDNAFFVWSPGENGLEEFGAHYHGSFQPWDYDSTSNATTSGWKAFNRIEDPAAWHLNNNGGDDPVAGN